MSLFQKSVEKKYLNNIDSTLIDKKYTDFQDYFGNSERQENIRNSKEEQFQEGFLRELFVKVLGYTLNPEPNFNLTTELKNISNSRKADGAILKGEDALAVIELKSTNTTDLDSVETQAFGYKNHHPKCVYVITSNFEKLRFYVQNAVDYIDFDLFKLTKDQFSLMWLCLSKDNLINDLPLKIKDSSVLQEENITKKLYADYSQFREDIYNNIVKNNPATDKLLLFKKTQKLLDRFLFIFFAEDRLLVPPNSITQIIEKWKDDVDFGDSKPLYSIFKQYFHVLNVGRPKSGKRQEIFAYNGGLFSPDEILDNISIDDEILHDHALKLSSYDFETDVDVNILGHIFEHSLGEIENLSAEILATAPSTREHAATQSSARGHAATQSSARGHAATQSSARGHAPLLNKHGENAPSTSKRKKDGIFYTPKYITKYIVENTIGKLCQEKRIEVGIQDEVLFERKKDRKLTKKAKNYFKLLSEYRSWLSQISILDPACGSGAFLNQALEFLLNEHEFISTQIRIITGDSAPIFSNVEKQILENNIYGVDINEESVDIAKLSLWLRTAKKGRKLNTLSNNIKCGNSLIDDPEVAGEKAFNWYQEFPNIFEKIEKKAWHITTATHNSRYSQRMFDNHVKLGEPVWLSEKEELIVTKTITEIVETDKLNIPAYNICKDHIHFVLVCEESEVPKIVGKLKSMSARACNIARGHATKQSARGHAPLSNEKDEAPLSGNERGQTQAQLWTQKFGCKEIATEEQLENSIEYIRGNREKHELPENKGLLTIVQKMTCKPEHALRTEYKGGFDVVIGNPPYVTKGLSSLLKETLNANFQTAQYQLDLYVAFIERGVNLTKDKGFLSYIVPNSWLKNMMMSECRKFLLNNLNIILMVPSLENVFPDASVDTMIFIGSKQKIYGETQIAEFQSQELLYRHIVSQKRFLSNAGYIFDVEVSKAVLPIVEKMTKDVSLIGKIFDVTRGINPYDKYRGQLPEVIATRAYHADYQKDKTFVPELKGLHTARYSYSWDSKHYISYGEWLAAPRQLKYFEGPRIVFREILGRTLVSTLITENFKIDRSLYIAILEEGQKDSYEIEYVLGILNSKLMAYYFRYTNNEFDNLFPKIRVAEFKKLPIKHLAIEKQKALSNKVDRILTLFNLLRSSSRDFSNLIQSKFDIHKLSKKLQNWYQLVFKEFRTELRKAKVQLSLSEEAEWLKYFNDLKNIAMELLAEIDQIDKEIDQMVYELYGLTEEEIKIVEGN